MDFRNMTDAELAAIGYRRTKNLVKRRVGQGIAIGAGGLGALGTIGGAIAGGLRGGGRGAALRAAYGAGQGVISGAAPGALYGGLVGGIQQANRRGAQLEMIRRGQATAQKFSASVLRGLDHLFEAVELKRASGNILEPMSEWGYPCLHADDLEKPLKLAERGRAIISYALESDGARYTADGKKRHNATLRVYDIEEVPEMPEMAEEESGPEADPEFATWGSPREVKFEGKSNPREVEWLKRNALGPLAVRKERRMDAYKYHLKHRLIGGAIGAPAGGAIGLVTPLLVKAATKGRVNLPMNRSAAVGVGGGSIAGILAGDAVAANSKYARENFY